MLVKAIEVKSYDVPSTVVRVPYDYHKAKKSSCDSPAIVGCHVIIVRNLHDYRSDRSKYDR